MKLSYSYSQIWHVAYPILLTLLVQNLIQVIGTAFLGHVGEVELGASAIAGIYYMVIFMLAFGFSTGSQILIGRRNGEQRLNKIGEIVVQGAGFLLMLALFMFLFTRIFSGYILQHLISSEKVLNAALSYLDFRIYGLFFSFINVMFRAFYVGITRTKVLSMNALLMALINVFFDYVLIFGNWGFPNLGIVGAAISSVLSELASVIFFLVYTFSAVDLKKYGFTGIKIRNMKVIRTILNVSISLMIQYFLSLGTWLFFFLAIEHKGETPLAISNIIRSLYMIISIPVFALSATANTLVSNTLGAERKEEVIPLIWRISRMTLVITGVFMFFVFLFPEMVLSVYTSDQFLIRESFSSLFVVMAVLPIISIGNVFFNAVSGTGNTRTALAIEILTLVIYVIYMWLVTSYLNASLAVCWTTELIYGGFIFLFSFIYMKKGNWQNRRI